MSTILSIHEFRNYLLLINFILFYSGDYFHEAFDTICHNIALMNPL
jgi:hypothetical protein